MKTPLHFLYIRYSVTIAAATTTSITMTIITIMIAVDELSSDWLTGCCGDLHVIPSSEAHTK